MKCCRTCSTGNNAWATCRNFSCWCHLEQRLVDEKSRLDYKDPTGETAVGNIIRWNKPKRNRRNR